MTNCDIKCSKFKGLKNLMKVDWDCDNCSFFEHAESFLKNLKNYPVAQRNIILGQFRKFFDKPQYAPANFNCSILKTKLHTLCSLNTCSYWLSNKSCNNCLLVYCVNKKVENISIEEFSFLYNKPFHEIRDLYDSALAQSRVVYFKRMLEDKPQINYISHAGVCCICEGVISGTPYYQTIQGLQYCGEKCWSEKEPCFVDVENKFNAFITDIMRVTVHICESLAMASSLLGLNKDQIKLACNRYLLKPASFYFSTVKN